MQLQDLKKVTAIQLFDNEQWYSVDIVIDNKYIVQWSTDELVSIPSANERTWKDEKDQEAIYTAGLDLRDLEAWLYAQGLKNDYHFLSEHHLTQNF